jgi:hypothetical protein
MSRNKMTINLEYYIHFYQINLSSNEYHQKPIIYLLITSKKNITNYYKHYCREIVLSNTSLDEKTEYTQITPGKEKYKNAEYDDNTVECLMKYLELESYEQLEDFLEHSHLPMFD